jgi:hypothetical protein
LISHPEVTRTVIEESPAREDRCLRAYRLGAGSSRLLLLFPFVIDESRLPLEKIWNRVLSSRSESTIGGIEKSIASAESVELAQVMSMKSPIQCIVSTECIIFLCFPFYFLILRFFAAKDSNDLPTIPKRRIISETPYRDTSCGGRLLAFYDFSGER